MIKQRILLTGTRGELKAFFDKELRQMKMKTLIKDDTELTFDMQVDGHGFPNSLTPWRMVFFIDCRSNKLQSHALYLSDFQLEVPVEAPLSTPTEN